MLNMQRLSVRQPFNNRAVNVTFFFFNSYTCVGVARQLTRLSLESTREFYFFLKTISHWLYLFFFV